MDAAGHELWSKTFAEKVLGSNGSGTIAKTWIGDVDGDKAAETIVAINQLAAHYLVCYSESGAEKWRFTPGRLVRTSKYRIESGFSLPNFEVFRPTPGATPLVVTIAVNYEFACQVALLTNQGKFVSDFWHAGHIGNQAENLKIADLDGDHRPEILLAGIANSPKRATLVVLSPDHVRGAASENDPDYQFLGLEPGSEKARILFPRSCLNRRTSEPFNWINGVDVLADGIVVGVTELQGEKGVGALYFFDRKLHLERLEPYDQFKIKHQALYSAGQINHPFSEATCFPMSGFQYLKTLESDR